MVVKPVRGGDPENTGRFSAGKQSLPEFEFCAPQLAGAPVPVVSPVGLTHVGSLDASAKKAWSYEGGGLSVSVNPEEWARIAHLGGPVWNLTKTDGVFLDYHEMTDAQKAAILAFGLERGYVVEQTGYTAAYFDDEWDQEMSSVYLTRAEAELEAEDNDADITEETIIVATALFPDSTVKAGGQWPEQILATVWVEQEAEGLDGVWWEDELDVSRLSAPRGVVVPRNIGDWVAGAVLEEEDFRDEPGLPDLDTSWTATQARFAAARLRLSV
jgi:hypothetical protein